LTNPAAAVVPELNRTYPAQLPDVSYGIAQNVTTKSLVVPGAATTALVPSGSTLRSTRTQTGFNDAGWTSGTTGVGYETAVAGFAVYNFVANLGVCSLAAAESVISDAAQQSAVYAENAPVINYLNTGGSANYGNDRSEEHTSEL